MGEYKNETWVKKPFPSDNFNINSKNVIPIKERNKCLKENFRSIQRAKNAIRAMSFSLLDMDSKQLVKDKSKTKQPT